jgi:glycosyltransferase involved in cell wall biosynthesis
MNSEVRVSDTSLKDCHVLHVINSLAVGGAERLLADLLPLTQRRGIGIRNTVLALDEEGDVFSSTLRSAGIDVIFASPYRGGDSASKRGASAKTRIFSPARIIDIVKTIRAIQPSIVHSHLAPSFHWCAAASLVCRDPVYVTTEHASENHRMSKPFLRGIEKFCYSRYTRVFCVSDSVAEAMSKWLGLPDEKLPVIPNGISLERFRTEKQAAQDVVQALAGRTGIAMTARFVPAKDHGTAIRAMVRLPDRYALVLIGDGPERETMEILADGLDVTNRCLFLGSRTDVPEVLAACGAYMQTSIKEGFGIAVLEAMAAGLPIVATDAPGLGPLVEGVGVLVAPGDFDALARAILGLEDEIAKKRMKTAAFERLGRYSIDRTADEYERKYRELYPDIEDGSSRKDAT